MSNKFVEHIHVIPEDDANRQIANGFLLHDAVDSRRIQILPEAGGWMKVLEEFHSGHANRMSQYSKRAVVLVIDCDESEARISKAIESVPSALKDRVFILGTWSEPERLKSDLGMSYEQIGKKMAEDCSSKEEGIWNHALLRHNASEIRRLRSLVTPFLFTKG